MASSNSPLLPGQVLLPPAAARQVLHHWWMLVLPAPVFRSIERVDDAYYMVARVLGDDGRIQVGDTGQRLCRRSPYEYPLTNGNGVFRVSEDGMLMGYANEQGEAFMVCQPVEALTCGAMNEEARPDPWSHQMTTASACVADPDLGDRILKVNHAGENGAIHIYTAQAFVARLTAPSMVPELLTFKSHEERHRDIFWTELSGRGRAACRSYGLCAAGGLVLGFVTALFGHSAMAATTAAVERVVLRHLHDQIVTLQDIDPRAADVIRLVLAEEQHHHDQSALHLPARQGGWLRLLQQVVTLSTEVVIWLGMKL